MKVFTPCFLILYVGNTDSLEAVKGYQVKTFSSGVIQRRQATES
jgi:hypothetical protein